MSHIYIPKAKKPWTPHEPEGMGLGVAGRYRLEVLKRDGEVRFDSGWQDNLVLDSGLNMMATFVPFSSAFRYIAVGSSNAAVSASQSLLGSWMAVADFTQISTLSNVTGYNNDDPSADYTYYTNTVTFAVGAVVGNVAELGLCSGTSSSSPLFTRALVKDAAGATVTIAVLASEQLRVTYQLRFYPPQGTSTFTVSLNGVTYNCSSRAAQVSSSLLWAWPGGGNPSMGYESGGWTGREAPAAYSGTIGARTSVPNGSVVWSNTGTAAFQGSYAAGSFTRTCRNTWATNQANGTFRSILVGGSGMGKHQVDFGASITKASTQTLYLDWKFNWGRYTAGA
ncbi:hypothetical protein GGR77_001504 [Xanthomonas translucens]